jgi:hypothetical protein
MKVKVSKIDQNKVCEIKLVSQNQYGNPFNEVDVDLVFTEPDGNETVVPAFWAGGNIWKARYTSEQIGEHKFISKCDNKQDEGLNNQRGSVKVNKYKGENKLYKHGRLQISDDNKYFEHKDGTSFFWLADTWWWIFTKRIKWPEEYKYIVKDRVLKGFTVAQICAGFFPGSDMDFKEQDANEKGFIWDIDAESINPGYFDMADLKVQWLVDSGIMPCIVGAWGFFIKWLGVEKMKKYWRYLIARWGAYPIVWCLAGEANLPFYDNLFIDENELKEKVVSQNNDWALISDYVHSIEPFNNLITIHPNPSMGGMSSRDVFGDPELYDFDFMQTGHMDQNSFEGVLDALDKAISARPVKPVIDGETNYEGIFGSCWDNVQRFLFWSHMCKGTAGHAYGATGLIELMSEGEVDLSGKWGESKWREALNFKGSSQLGIGKELLENFDWQRFESHPEWVEPHESKENRYFPYCAGIPGEVRIIYIPGIHLQKPENFLIHKEIKIKYIEEDVNYMAYFFNPRTGECKEEVEVQPDKNGEWMLPQKYGFISSLPTMIDWVLVVQKKFK